MEAQADSRSATRSVAARGESTRIPLGRDLSSRILAGIGCFFVALPALAMVVVTVSLSGPGGDTIGALFCGPVAIGLVWLTWSIGRTSLHSGAWIDIRRDSLVVHHPVVLRRDLIVQRDQVRAAAISVYDDPSWWLDDQFDLVREKGGITMHASREELRATLEATARFTVPLVDENDLAHPNVIVVFNRPVRLSHVRRGLRTGAALTWIKRAEPDQIARGLLLRTTDPFGARTAFARWDVRERLTRDDRDLLVPTKDDVRRYRRFRVFAFIGGVVAVLALAARAYEFLRTLFN